MKANSLYMEAHLIVSAVRILEHRNDSPPALEDVAGILSVSTEETARICRRLKPMGIIETVEKSGETRVFVNDHLRIEDIEDRPEENSISEELEKFRKKKEGERKKLDDLRTSQQQKRKKVQEEIEQKLRNKLSKKQNGH
ncbi:MAG: hypothetical protein K9J79_01680 [Desulfobacteraceae bacterium]|nr:hypothetical protein [Desulfobacteraceae bacterium]MCF8094048.1 hypothetical protein [Desulfobacteraceae bacterium]